MMLCLFNVFYFGHFSLIFCSPYSISLPNNQLDCLSFSYWFTVGVFFLKTNIFTGYVYLKYLFLLCGSWHLILFQWIGDLTFNVIQFVKFSLCFFFFLFLLKKFLPTLRSWSYSPNFLKALLFCILPSSKKKKIHLRFLSMT